MLTLARSMKIYFSSKPADMRKSFDGLSGLVASTLEADPLSGHLFVFLNHRADRIKMLYWDGDGLALWYKRLEAGTFRVPVIKHGDEKPRIELTAAELAMLLEGIELKNIHRRARYALPANTR
jgi:transposase